MPDLTPYFGPVRALWLSLPGALRYGWATYIVIAMLLAGFSWTSGRMLMRWLPKRPSNAALGPRATRIVNRLLSKPRPSRARSWFATVVSTMSFGIGGETLFLGGPLVGAILCALTFLDVSLFQQIRNRDNPSTSEVVGQDDTGRSATYQLIMVSSEYYWKYGDTASVVNFEGREVSLEEKLQSNGIAALLRKSTDVIAVGTASCVGSGPDEETRAYERSRTLVGWVKQIDLGPSLENLYLLNLGQYNEPCGSGPRENEQRVVLIVGVTKKQPGVDIRQSFRDAIMSSKGISRRLDLRGYANWPESKFVLEPAM